MLPHSNNIETSKLIEYYQALLAVSINIFWFTFTVVPSIRV